MLLPLVIVLLENFREDTCDTHVNCDVDDIFKCQEIGVQEAALYSKATLHSLQMVRCRVLRHLRSAITSNIFLSAQFEKEIKPHIEIPGCIPIVSRAAIQ